MTKQNYKISELAKRYNVHKVTIYQWIKRGKLHCDVNKRGFSTVYRVTAESVVEFESKYGIQPVA